MMFTKITAWYHDWEQELLQVLRDPSYAAKTPPGYRRWWANHFAAMSAVERQQVHELTLRWPLGRLLRSMLTLVGLLAVLGGAIHLIWPQIPLGKAIRVTQLVGTGIASVVFTMWFYYRVFIRHMFKIVVSYLLLACAGAVVGMTIKAIELGIPVTDMLARHAPYAFAVVLGGCAALLLVALAVSAWRNAGFERIALSLHARAEQERLGRQLTDTQLRLLRAQIEPHFLFNTLGAVQQLAERDHARAAAELTANLIAFLRSTAGGMTRETATLREEFELAQAYLAVMKARLGERLEVDVQLPAGLAGVTLPGMAVLTLAENAVKHGLEPSRRPVKITLSAEREGDVVRVLVTDTGVGLSQTSSGGLGLQNLRDRLRLAFGSGASLALYEQEAGGVVAELALPVNAEVAA